MIFAVHLTPQGSSPACSIIVDAPSFYDAREWARSAHGERLDDVVLHAHPVLESDGVIVVGATHQTPFERERDHRESITTRAYEKGVAAGIELGVSQAVKQIKAVQKPRKR